jgi:hypothetical protein
MAPRKPKPDDDASSTTSELPPVLKPKNEKAKVTKPKAEKAKNDKPKVEKPKAVKKEKVEKDGEAAGKKEVKADGAKKEGDGKKVGEKEKVKAVNGEEAIEIMARYLKEQNRPYSATEVSANLHGKVCLLSLLILVVPPCKIEMGVNGKTGHEDGSGQAAQGDGAEWADRGEGYKEGWRWTVGFLGVAGLFTPHLPTNIPC